jgi:sugar-specific transcriptional regulator TrmB
VDIVKELFPAYACLQFCTICRTITTTPLKSAFIMLEKNLQELGLSENEANIYAVLLSNSPSGATFIASKLGLSRSSVYTVLDCLISKGLVGTTFKNEVKQFIAEGHSALEQILKKEKEQLSKKMNLLESMRESMEIVSRSDLNVPKVIFFEGQEGLKKVYMSMMRNAQDGETMFILRDEFVWDKNWSFVFSEDWHQRVRRLKIKKNLKTDLLINDSELERKNSSLYKERKALKVRYLPKKNSVKQFAFYIVGDMASIMSMENNNLLGIQITNKHLTENFKKMFEGLWRNAK